MKYYLITAFSLLTIVPSLNAAAPSEASLYYRDAKGVLRHVDIATPTNLVDVYQNTPHIFGPCNVFTGGEKYRIGDQNVGEREYTIALHAQNLHMYKLILGITHPDRVGSTNNPEAWAEYRKRLEFLAKARIEEEEERIKKLTNPRRCSIL